MHVQQLNSLLASGGSETLEFKEAFDRETIETVSAFANSKGGSILIGISDEGFVKGVQIGKRTLNDWLNQISQSTEPRVIPHLEAIDSDGKIIVAIEIREHPLKPVSARGRCYKRVGKSNRTCTPQEIAHMHLVTTGMSWDLLAARNATRNDIEPEKVRHYIRSVNRSGRRDISENEEPLEVLNKRGLLKDGTPTWAALFLFSSEPSRFLTQCSIHCGRFKDPTTILDDRLIQGDLTHQIEEAMNFLKKHIALKLSITGAPKRKEQWEYPLEALREALINAVCHRDYSLSSNTDIRIFDDMIIISNPGALPPGMTLDDLYRPHISVLRNRGIAGIFYDLGLIEQWGSGISRMRDACRNAGLPEPRFKVNNFFQVIFSRNRYTEEHLAGLGLNERQIKAMRHIAEKGRITNKEYRSLASLSDEGALLDLKDLMEKNLIVQAGSGRSSHYILKSVGDLGD